MDKEAQLKALRELTGANKNANTSANSANEGANKPDVSKVDDIAVMKYLDMLRRKATTIDEVDVIDAIVKGLFYEGQNKITGRVHGTVVSEQKSEEKPKTDRNAYQREYMRKRRAKNA
jgi:hypothetical protein